MSAAPQEQRLDKWLWCARLTKTRTLAVRLIQAGKVRLNGTRVLKVSRTVKPGDVLTLTAPRGLAVVRVTGAVERRVSPALALSLYDDLTPPAEAVSPAEKSARAGPRPTKRDRRLLDALLDDFDA